MHMYEVKKGTPGKLLIHEHLKDLVVEDFVVRKNLTFEDHQNLGDPIRLQNGNLGHPVGSPIHDFTKAGYVIFTNIQSGMVGEIEDEKYFLAIQYARVKVL